VVFSSGPSLHSGTLKLGTPLHPPELTAETIVFGIYEVIYTRVVRGYIPRAAAAAAGPRVLRDAPVCRSRGGADEYRRLQQEFARAPR
jgi:hypothetical protein